MSNKTASQPAEPTTPAEFSLAWYDALIAQQAQKVDEAFALAHQAVGALGTLQQLRQLAAQKEADDATE